MIDSNHKTSLLIPSQLPAFIREDPNYSNFVLFLQSYYEWMEQNGNAIDGSKNLQKYNDLDSTPDEFIEYFYKEFLSYFPKDILANKKTVAKIAKELYQTKGTPSSYKFLFKVLYNTDVDFFFTKDAVLKASGGNWYIPRSLNLSTSNQNFLKTKGLRVFGETTKSIATIENAVYDGSKTIVYISNIVRSFQSGENVLILDDKDNPVSFDGVLLNAKIIGQVTQVILDNNNKGLQYQSGDPITIYGGLNSPTGHGASAVVGDTTKGSMESILVQEGGYGYRISPNTIMNLVNAPLAAAFVASVNTNDPNKISDVSLIPIDTINPKVAIRLDATNYNFSNISVSNANTSLINAFSSIEFTTYPISSVILTNPGVGLTQTPGISATSLYTTDDVANPADISKLGILAPVQILSGGVGYEVNDTITFEGGTGYGAHANVISVSSTGSIIEIHFVYNGDEALHRFPLGGMGYRIDSLPTVHVHSANTSAHGASLYVPGVLGTGATFTTSLNRVGQIESIIVTDTGADYISEPIVSLKNQDLAVTGLQITNLPKSGDIIYQGTSIEDSTYFATVDQVNVLYSFPNPLDTIYSIRVFNYNTVPTYGVPLNIDSRDISVNLTNQYSTLNPTSRYNSSGVITYGDGTAKASAVFLNGLISGTGQYVDTSGQLSSFDVLQSQDYNNYTYEITLEKELVKYKQLLLDLLHPTGSKVLGRFSGKSFTPYKFNLQSAARKGHTLSYYTGNPSSYAQLNNNLRGFNQSSKLSSNVVNFFSLSGTDLTDVVFANESTITINSSGGPISGKVKEIYSIFETPIPNLVQDLNLGTNEHIDLSMSNYRLDLQEIAENYSVVLDSDNWLTFMNVAYATSNAGSNAINITSFTDVYDSINGGHYTNPNNPLVDIVFVGDNISDSNNDIRTVTSVDYVNNIIYVDPPSSNSVNSTISVGRTIQSNSVTIFGVTET